MVDLEMLNKLLGYGGKQLLLLSLKDNVFCGETVALDKNQKQCSRRELLLIATEFSEAIEF